MGVRKKYASEYCFVFSLLVAENNVAVQQRQRTPPPPRIYVCVKDIIRYLFHTIVVRR